MKNIWVPVSGQIAQQRKVETIANNVANANTPGFKKDELVFKEHLTQLSKGSTDIHMPNKEWAPEHFYHTHGAENAQVQIDGNYTTFEQGQLTPTNNPLDLGLQGQGFFEVLAPNGIRYTRKGNFNISKEGELVTEQGFKVLSTPGAQGRAPGAQIPPEDRSITLPLNAKVNVDIDGNLYHSDTKIATLNIVEFTDPHALRKEGNSLFINNHQANPVDNENQKTRVHQGFLEQSNVNAISEMSELIKAHRHFENIQKAIKTYDDISGRAVNDIARF